MLAHPQKLRRSINNQEKNERENSQPENSNSPVTIQAKPAINDPNDIHEKEADEMADKVMRTPLPEPINFSASTNSINRKCSECEEEEKDLQRKESNSEHTSVAPPVVNDVLSSSGGSALDPATRSFMEPRFNYDFCNVKVHSDDVAAKSADAINALAYTSGNNIVFNSGQLNTNSDRGKRLLAHELTHVIQQSNNLQPRTIQRDGMGDVRVSEANQALIAEIQAAAAYKALVPDDKKLADEIIDEINKKKISERSNFLLKLKLLFDTIEKSAADITTETNASTTAAVTAEKARVAKPEAKKNLDLEEKAVKDAARTWTAIKGKFGGGTYYVDNTSSTNIVVRAKIFLSPAGTGTVANVDEIKKMEDGIEKAASTKGYIVDIQFVNDASDPDTFKVDVNPGEWEVATNWSGGDPVGYAHELHHMFAFEWDRYNYIEAHAGNESMKIHRRLYWFREELKKPAGYNDPTSIMDAAAHPNDSDVCAVAGLNTATCLAERKKLVKP